VTAMTSELPLTVSAQYAISPQRLFALMSTPKYLQQWFSPHQSIAINVIEHHFRIGGAYRIGYTLADGERSELRGEFLEIESPGLIKFSWVWQAPDIHANIESVVTWRLVQINSNTQLTVLHERAPSKEFFDRHNAGWLATLKRLSSLVT